MQNEEVAVLDAPTAEVVNVKTQEYIVGTPPSTKLTDTIGENSTISPESKAKLSQFEDMMIYLADEAKKNGQPVGIDYFIKYKPRFIDRAIGMAGAVGMAFMIPIVKRSTDKVGAKPLYMPNGKTGSELPKLTTMDPNIQLTPEEQRKIAIEGKSSNDRRILGRLGRILRKTSLDELPQAASVSWGIMNTVGPRSVRRMVTRAENAGLDKSHPEAHTLYKEAAKRGVRKGFLGGYTMAARGENEETQYIADAILLKYMNAAAAPWIVRESIKNALLRRGAK